MIIYGQILRMKGGGDVNCLEEIATIVVRIRELRGKIEGPDEGSITWLERLELGELREKLEKMKQELIKAKEA